MTCYSPNLAFRDNSVLSFKSGNPVVRVLGRKHFYPGIFNDPRYFTLPCSRCIGCRLYSSGSWGARMFHESKLYDNGLNNCFITLTYDNDSLPSSGSLVKKDFQDFMKRFREKCGSRIRFYHAGEYGEHTFRPHYHAAIFNFNFLFDIRFKHRDGSKVFTSKYHMKCGDFKLYTSTLLSDLWQHRGHCSVGTLTFNSAAYVARYICSKVTGDRAKLHYKNFSLLPEYATMSNRPGIGREWISKHHEDVFPRDFVVMNSSKVKPPRYYDKFYDGLSPIDFELIKNRRIQAALLHSEDSTSDRLFIREICKEAQVKSLKRAL